MPGLLALLLPPLFLCRILLAPPFALAVFLFYRNGIVRANIARAFPELDARGRRRLHRRFCLYYANATFEILKGVAMSRREVRRRMTLHNLDLLRSCAKRGETALLILPHYGNWEWFWLALIDALGDEAWMCAVYRPLHVKAVDRLALRLRTRWGGRMVPDRRVARYLRRNASRSHILCLVGDQRPSKKEPKQWVSMLGRQTALQPGAGKLPIVLQSPLFYADIRCERPGYYSAHLSLLTEPPYARGEEGRILQAFADAVTRTALVRPECFLWSMNRWKFKPEAAGESR